MKLTEHNLWLLTEILDNYKTKESDLANDAAKIYEQLIELRLNSKTGEYELKEVEE